MAVIGVISSCTETVEQLEEVLRDRGHVVRCLWDETGELYDRRLNQETDLIVVDMDCEPDGRMITPAEQVRRISEQETTAGTAVLVAASGISETDLALACAYGASGLLGKPFRKLKTLPDTERVLAAAYRAG